MIAALGDFEPNLALQVWGVLQTDPWKNFRREASFAVMQILQWLLLEPVAHSIWGVKFKTVCLSLGTLKFLKFYRFLKK